MSDTYSEVVNFIKFLNQKQLSSPHMEESKHDKPCGIIMARSVSSLKGGLMGVKGNVHLFCENMDRGIRNFN